MKDVLTNTEVGRWIGIGSVIVAITLSYTGLTTQLSLLTQKTDSISEKAILVDSKIESIQEKQNAMDIKLTRITTIIEGAQAKGQISRAKSFTEFVAPFLAFITPAPQQVTYTYNPPPVPIPPPTPTPSLAVCIANLCL